MRIRATVLIALIACGGGRVSSPPPQTPIAAAGDAPPGSAVEACAALVADLDKYQYCVDDKRRPSVIAWHDYAETTFTALAHDGISDAERAEVARGCAKAGAAVRAALATCPATAAR